MNDSTYGATFGAAMLLDLFEGDRAAVAEMLEVAIGAIESDVLKMERALELQDASMLAAAAHSLKGASSSIGSAHLSTLCATIQNDATAGLAATTAIPLEDVRDATGKLVADIRLFCREPRDPRGAANHSNLRGES